MKGLKIISIVAVIAILMSVISLPTIAAGGIEEIVYDAFADHRNTSNTAQENAIIEVEGANAAVVAKGIGEAPWSTILSGPNGLLTNEITGKLSSIRTLTLEFLRGKTITLSSANAEIEAAIAAFKSDNDAILTRYDLDDVSIKDSAARYNQLEAELTEIFKDYNSFYKKVTETSNTLLVDGVAFSGLSDAQVREMFSEKITKVFKDANSLLFASKATWQAKFAELLCGENKITMGLIIGSDGAAALANAATMQRVYDYIDSSDILETVASYQTDLYSEDFSKTNTAFYALITDVFNDILELNGMEDVKVALEGIGWTTENIVSAMKVTQDAADVNFYSRAINLNMILGRYLGIYKVGTLQDPVKVFVNTAPTDEYDIKVRKGSYRASVINVIDTKVFNSDGTASSIVTSDNDGRLKFTVSESDIGTGYTVGCYRDGSDKSKIWNYIATKNLDVADGAVYVQSVIIKEGNIVVYIDESEQLTAIISPIDATNKNVTWTISDSSIASISSTGKVTGKKLGYATVTVTTEDGGFTATITVTVKKRAGGMGSAGSYEPTVTPTPTVKPTPTQPPTGSHYFSDLENHWAADELDELIEKGVVEGYGESTGVLEGVGAIYKFYPDRPISRAEFATIICRMMSLPVTKEGVIYKDTENHWSRDYVATATKYGYMIGVSEDMFAPDWPIPREQVIAVILRVLTFGYDVLNPGTKKIYTSDEILELVKEHFDYEYTDLKQQIPDIESGSGWARAYVEMAYKDDIVEGYEDHTMRPLINATRAEAIVMAKRALWK